MMTDAEARTLRAGDIVEVFAWDPCVVTQTPAEQNDPLMISCSYADGRAATMLVPPGRIVRVIPPEERARHPEWITLRPRPRAETTTQGEKR